MTRCFTGGRMSRSGLSQPKVSLTEVLATVCVTRRPSY
jgi:hypothetical protein